MFITIKISFSTSSITPFLLFVLYKVPHTDLIRDIGSGQAQGIPYEVNRIAPELYHIDIDTHRTKE
jgi:hypothetical protein